MARWKTVRKLIKFLVPGKFLDRVRTVGVLARKRALQQGVRSLPTDSSTRPRYIVSMTSFGSRVARSAPYALYSLLRQSVLPDKIILWLGHGTPIPPELMDLQSKGVEVRFCVDCGPHTKLVPSLVEFPSDILVTADDDVAYPRDWFSQLKEEHLRNPGKICAHRAHEIEMDTSGMVLPYTKWRKDIQGAGDSIRVFPTGVGGVLYPPASLHADAVNVGLFRELTPTTDDIWFWAMARLRGTEHSLVPDSCLRTTKAIDFESQRDALSEVNITEGQNDIQFRRVLDHYPELLEKLD